MNINFLNKFHSFYLEHNPHKAYYETVSDYIEELEHRREDVSDLQKCIETDELWTLQVYPITPIRFYWFGGPTLAAVLAVAEETLKDEKGF